MISRNQRELWKVVETGFLSVQVFHFQLSLCILQGRPVRDQLPPCFHQASGGRGALGTGGTQRCWARHFSLSFSQDERAPFVASFTCSLSFRWLAKTSGQISVHHEICRRWSWPISILWLPRRTWAQSDTPNTARLPNRKTFLQKELFSSKGVIRRDASYVVSLYQGWPRLRTACHRIQRTFVHKPIPSYRVNKQFPPTSFQ